MPKSLDPKHLSVRTLVLGGIRSGKSLWAESCIADDGQPVRYLATAAGDGSGGWQRRVAEHRRRRPPQWSTVETLEVAGELRRDRHTPTLVDDLGGWLTGHLDRLGWGEQPMAPAVADLVAAIEGVEGPLVLVSPEVGLSVVPATAAGARFADELGALNQRVAGSSERVVLIVAGQPLWIKR